MKTARQKRSNANTKRQAKVTGIDPDDPKFRPKWDNFETYEDLIDSLTVEAKWKDRLKDILRLVFVVGKRIVEIGKRIIEVILAVAKKYPKTAITFAIGCVLSLLISNIPLLGALLGPLVMGITCVVTFGVFLTEALQKSILDEFAPLAKARMV